MIEFSLKELNDLYYCVGKVRSLEFKMIEDKELDELFEKIDNEIERINKEELK